MKSDIDDGFVEIQKRGYTPVSAPMMIRIMAMRSGIESISLTLSEECAAKLEGDGWPRFNVAWNPKTFQFRIRRSSGGQFEMHRTPKGGRYMLRWPVPKEAAAASKLAEPAPHTFDPDGRTLLVTLPPSLRRPVVLTPLSELAERARVQIPAPKYGSGAGR